jgi:phosphate transport system protein
LALQQTPHTSKVFDEDLDNLRTLILEMGGLVEYQIRYAMEALRSDGPQHVSKVMAEEVRVNEMERRIDALLTQVLARRFPAAIDLRLVMAASKTVTDLERIGDEAKKIALTAQRLVAQERLRHGFAEIGVIAGIVIDMLKRALDAFARVDDADAVAIQKEDARVDEHFHAILRQLLTYMIEDPRTISPAIEMVFVAKSLERIGDHAKNISEYVVYVTRGYDVRHVTVAELERAVRS